jgi:hypothetical protein
MRIAVTLLLVLTVSVASALAVAPRPHVLADAIHAMHGRAGLAHLARQGRRVVIDGASQEAQWRGYVAASVYAARGHPLRSVQLIRPKADGGEVTLGFPAVNCACSYPGMHRLHTIRPATGRQVVHAIDIAAQHEDAHIDRIELLHPLAYAPVIVVTPRHPSSFVSRSGAPSLVEKLNGRIEGAFVLVRDGSGRLVASGGYTGRSYTVFGEVGWAIPV